MDINISLDEDSFNKLIGGEEVVVETPSGAMVHIILQKIGFARMQYLVEMEQIHRQPMARRFPE